MNARGDTGEESEGDLKQGGKLTADKNLWVLGNFSRFIRPGYKRISLDGADEMDNLLGSAWLSPEGSEAVAVLVNMSYGRRKVDLSIASADAGEVRTYVTDRSRNLRFDASLQDLHDMVLSPRSVTTVVIGLEDASGMADLANSPMNMMHSVYDLQGRMVVDAQGAKSNVQLPKGIYIMNGRKILVK